MARKRKFITAYDPKLGKRVLFEVKGKMAISTITGHKFRLKA